ncbi:MAG TPA: hypothetical protein DCZ59_02950 [Bacteroidetes bacterium]|nr:hypothetical protein [Bacteroidota bacterium]
MMISVAPSPFRTSRNGAAALWVAVVTIMLLAGSLCAVAQNRPWSYRNSRLPGSTPKVTAAAGALVIFDKVAFRSIDHGVTLDSIRDLEGEPCDFFDFSQGISFAITYESSERKAKVFFSQGGSSWSKVDSILDVARPTSGVASGFDWYMASENGSVIHRIGETTTTIKGPSSEPIRQLVLTTTAMVANVAGRAVAFSIDKGASWSTLPAEGLGQLHVMNDQVYAATGRGIVSLNVSDGKLEQVGTWDLPSGQPPATLDIDSHVGQLYAVTADSSYRMFRLDRTDDTWVRWGLPLPCQQASASHSIMAIESGWAVAALNITQGKKDTSGIYAFDLNDLTRVHDEAGRSESSSGILVQGDACTIDLGPNVVSAELFDMSGRSLQGPLQVQQGHVRIELHGIPSGMYVLVSRRADATHARSLILR